MIHNSGQPLEILPEVYVSRLGVSLQGLYSPESQKTVRSPPPYHRITGIHGNLVNTPAKSSTTACMEYGVRRDNDRQASVLRTSFSLHPENPRYDGTTQLSWAQCISVSCCLSSLLLFFPTIRLERESKFLLLVPLLPSPPPLLSLSFSSIPFSSFFLPPLANWWRARSLVDRLRKRACPLPVLSPAPTRPPVESNPLLGLDDPPVSRRLLAQTAEPSSPFVLVRRCPPDPRTSSRRTP
ncbi:hypothetical protein F1880_000474 [Penicillium rolfsii]|nr:hypothetical protein F1880_000474 [Penicillium rolfsii]